MFQHCLRDETVRALGLTIGVLPTPWGPCGRVGEERSALGDRKAGSTLRL